jgi:hypothetical protein
MNLDEMRARVRADLHDEDENNYRWTDDALSRHIRHAVRELSVAVPLQARSTLLTSDGSRELPLDSLQDMVSIEAVEYPAGMYPPRYVRFSTWGPTLILLTESTPVEGEEVRVYYGKLHTLSEETSTIPPALEELAAVGAEGYAAIEWASFATNRVNLGGEDTWRSYLAWGQDRLAAFLQGLAKHSRRNALRPRRLYRPYEARDGMTADRGPR